MDYQAVFERREQKYLLTPAQAARLRQELAAGTVPDRFGDSTVASVYYDTEDFALIRASLEKPVYKEKLRLRGYGAPSRGTPVFLELKKKYRGVVYKRRATLPLDEAEACLAGVRPAQTEQILEEIRWFLHRYSPTPKVLIACERSALVGREEPDLRLTLDRGLRWRTIALSLAEGSWGAPLLPDGGELLEVKSPGALPLWLVRLLAGVGAFPTSFSKYGACYEQFLLPQSLRPAKITQLGGLIHA